MREIYPLKLGYVDKTALWGGARLRERYGKASSHEKLAETWELSVRQSENSVIKNGVYEGMTLGEYLRDMPNAPQKDGRFPLLIKFIDATDSLSVQVHPDDAYAAEKENDAGKTEMWYILEAAPDAKLIYGLAEGVDKAAFAKAVRDGKIEQAMGYIPVKQGDCFFIPSGMLHAIGAGILIAEIQQNSDLTYRVYDFDRRDAKGNLRPLHTEKALDVVRPFTEEEINAIRFEAKEDGEEQARYITESGAVTVTPLAHCRYFCVDKLSLSGATSLCSPRESFAHLLCIEGEATVRLGDVSVSLCKGESLYLPNGKGQIAGKAEILVSRVD